MREASLISELRIALRRRGVWRARAERLIQEWTEHVRDDAAQRVEKGVDPELAREAAWRALGNPEVLAASAARELTQASWLGRHPWLGGLALPVFGWLLVMAAIVFLPGKSPLAMYTNINQADRATLLAALHTWEMAFNWIPWVLAVAWLARIASRMPGGWKLYWITAVALTLCAGSVWMVARPPVSESHGTLYLLFPAGILGIAQYAITHVLLYTGHFPSWNTHLPAPPYAVPWLQTALMALGAIAFHFKAAYRTEARHA